MKSQWDKFRHRTLTKVFLGYAVVAWVLIQVIEAVLPTFETPLWVAQTITFLLILGFPIAILVGWASEKLPSVSSDSENISGAPQLAHATPRRALAWIAVASCAVVGLFGFYMMPFIFDGSGFEERSTTQISPIEQVTSPNVLRANIGLGPSRQKANGLKSEIAISPNGSKLIYRVSKPDQNGAQYFSRDFNSFNDPLQMLNTGTGFRAVENRSGYPKFSEVDEWVYFYSDRGSKLNRSRLDGGAAQTILQGDLLINSYVVRSPYIFFGTEDGRVVRQMIGSEEEEEIYSPENVGERAIWLSFIGDSNQLMATILPPIYGEGNPRIKLIDSVSGTSQTLVPNGYMSKYAKSGHVVYLLGDTLWAMPFDEKGQRIAGNTVPVIDGIESTVSRDLYYGNYDFSDNGRLVYVAGELMQRGSGNFNVLDIELTRMNHEGVTTRLDVPQSSFAEITASPDQNFIAMARLNESGARDIWVWDIFRETLGRRSFGGVDGTPIWSRDGRYIYYQTEQNSTAEIWRALSNGSSSPEYIATTPFSRVDLESISIGDEHIVYSENSSTGDLYLYELNGQNIERSHLPLIDGNGQRVSHSRISPDGNWIAYISSETGDRHVYIQSFPDTEMGKYQITSETAVRSIEWDPGGTKIYFTVRERAGAFESALTAGSTQIFGVDLEYGPQDESGRPEFLIARRPELVVETNKSVNGNAPRFDVLSENEFIFTTDPESVSRILEAEVDVNVVENWFEELAVIAPPADSQ